MGSRPRRDVNTRRRPNSYRQSCRRRKSSRTAFNDGARPHSSVSEKLEALKKLVPAGAHNGDVKADQLFQQTADYIVLLRTQVSVLQTLVDFYGSTQSENVIV